MASTTVTWSPSSPQLRLAMRCRISLDSPAVLVGAPAMKLTSHRRLRLLSVARCRREGLKRRRNGASPIVADSTGGTAADFFSGWSDAEHVEDPVHFKRNEWFGGIIGAGTAGLVLVAGLSFAAMALCNQSTSGPKLQLEPLTAQQEVLLASDTESGEFEKNENEKGIYKDLLSPSEFNGTFNDNKLEHDNESHLIDTSNGNGATNTAPIQEDLENVSALDRLPIGMDKTPISPKLPESEVVRGSFAAPIPRESDGNLDIGSPEATSNLSDRINLDNDIDEGKLGSEGKGNCDISVDSSSSSSSANEPVTVNFSVSPDLEPVLETQSVPIDILKTIESPPTEGNLESRKMLQFSVEMKNSSLEMKNFNEIESSEKNSVSAPAHPKNKQSKNDYKERNDSIPVFGSPNPRSYFSPSGIPAPSVVSAALQVHPGKVLVPAVVDQVQGQALAALQVLKVIEAEAQPSDLCTRREYARWLVTATSVLSRNTTSKVYPAMYIENVTEVAFDDVTPEDPDFPSIQGLAEAGLISSKLSNKDLFNDDLGPFYFSPERLVCPLSRQDLVSWKMALEKRQLPEADRKIHYQISGFIDIDKINPDAWPALVADLSAGEQGIIALAFGFTRLFQPNKPVTKAQVAVALATGEASDMVSEELARIEADSAAENAVSAHNALVAEVEKDINASFEKELLIEREKIDAVEKMAEGAKHELERLRAEREAENIALMKDRASIDSEMEILSRLRLEVEEQLESLMNNKVEISYKKERINKLQKETEAESQEIVRLQHELEVERKALCMARAWAEDEAKRAREQAKALEEARDRWERHGIKVVVDKDLHEETVTGFTWVNVGKQVEAEGTITRSEALVSKLEALASEVKGKSRVFINKIIQRIHYLISVLKEWASKACTKAEELKDMTVSNARESVHELQQSTAEFRSALKEGAKRVAGDCRGEVEKFTRRFRT
ncbi:hypothetical protein F3Y22_tig00003041pilonHSYRG00266 [Hibiscus syriacus]|uniref:SLH domain-containing protein n=1 Tax=Hibiscus syriacus TaxID=106335 RepID=A0A6A3CQS9_HIBSY|nr:hypothetical protein F3Y22_tig00003041pilonHSYRG00266 [Hibiscus syriacus]